MSSTPINTISPMKSYKVGHVTSADGTTIAYRQFGHGPGLVLVHGAMWSAQNFTELATELSAAFTVYAYDRRGRGASGPTGNHYSMHKEVEDLDAILMQTGAENIFGISAGGIIGLREALTSSAVRKVALYEPALSINGSVPIAWLTQYNKEMTQGKVAAAMVTSLKATRMGPPILNIMPRWLLEALTNMVMKSEDKKAKPGDVTMRSLAPTLRDDFQLVSEMENTTNDYKAVQAEVLLLSGSKSPAYFKTSIDALENALPNVHPSIQLDGLDHGGCDSAKRGGKPKLVALELRKFFTE